MPLPERIRGTGVTRICADEASHATKSLNFEIAFVDFVKRAEAEAVKFFESGPWMVRKRNPLRPELEWLAQLPWNGSPRRGMSMVSVRRSAQKMTPAGFEPPPESPGKTHVSDSRGIKSGNIQGGCAHETTPDGPDGPTPSDTSDANPPAPIDLDDADLTAVIRAWPDLRESTRKIIAGIVADAEARREGDR